MRTQFAGLWLIGATLLSWVAPPASQADNKSGAPARVVPVNRQKSQTYQDYVRRLEQLSAKIKDGSAANDWQGALNKIAAEFDADTRFSPEQRKQFFLKVKELSDALKAGTSAPVSVAPKVPEIVDKAVRPAIQTDRARVVFDNDRMIPAKFDPSAPLTPTTKTSDASGASDKQFAYADCASNPKCNAQRIKIRADIPNVSQARPTPIQTNSPTDRSALDAAAEGLFGDGLAMTALFKHRRNVRQTRLLSMGEAALKAANRQAKSLREMVSILSEIEQSAANKLKLPALPNNDSEEFEQSLSARVVALKEGGYQELSDYISYLWRYREFVGDSAASGTIPPKVTFSSWELLPQKESFVDAEMARVTVDGADYTGWRFRKSDQTSIFMAQSADAKMRIRIEQDKSGARKVFNAEFDGATITHQQSRIYDAANRLLKTDKYNPITKEYRVTQYGPDGKVIREESGNEATGEQRVADATHTAEMQKGLRRIKYLGPSSPFIDAVERVVLMVKRCSNPAHDAMARLNARFLRMCAALAKAKKSSNGRLISIPSMPPSRLRVHKLPWAWLRK
jgi:hypothetical protein